MENKTIYSKEQITKEILKGLEDNRAYICCQDLESGEMDAYSFLGSFFKSRHLAKFRLSHILLPVSPTVEEKPDGYISLSKGEVKGNFVGEEQINELCNNIVIQATILNARQDQFALHDAIKPVVRQFLLKGERKVTDQEIEKWALREAGGRQQEVGIIKGAKQMRDNPESFINNK